MTDEIAVIGAGRMGEGIALTFLAAGLPVVLADVKERTDDERSAYCGRVRDRLAEQLRAKVGDDAALAGLTVCGRETAELSGAAVVFEAVPEVIEVKREALAWACTRVGESAVIASTTSTFLVTEIAKLVDRPGRVVNAHWLNPADLMPLVEVSRSDDTDPDAVATLTGLLERIGKVPVVCGPAAGYIVPRLQALVMNEAARMVEEGVASAADIDLAVRAGLGPRFSVLGPLEFIDWGGCDILYYASRYLKGELGERFQHPDVIERHMTTDRRGLQDGAGFYDFDPAGVPEYRAARMREFQDVFGLREPHLRNGTPVPTKQED
ncbi:3-hydroxyacyl-CoA dehydrogenase NAD-binding domain-containing protein [Saccharopolyspora indica]|uniref:3-hydroxyacyl-CoA dehydrogenase NAD-binding domain-containing protein n=1 Tax=Saccharopolyspora indica TaxID=1229659 RepID=UPI0022EAE6B5|nr:3-hydroxyacyl-CoA dehydrogenase NAD-binding domain-containing protein [Saccharopolyspora indica]MDA3642470.1 3-hydroxyacyl-CoA dehydrogenase NAD-binding domain-containing protein [Saccharopolyspora indica]